MTQNSVLAETFTKVFDVSSWYIEWFVAKNRAKYRFYFRLGLPTFVFVPLQNIFEIQFLQSFSVWTRHNAISLSTHQLDFKTFFKHNKNWWCWFNRKSFSFRLQKCHRCSKLIPLNEFVLNVSGQPYHVTCFACDVCHQALQVSTKNIKICFYNFCFFSKHLLCFCVNKFKIYILFLNSLVINITWMKWPIKSPVKPVTIKQVLW